MRDDDRQFWLEHDDRHPYPNRGWSNPPGSRNSPRSRLRGWIILGVLAGCAVIAVWKVWT